MSAPKILFAALVAAILSRMACALPRHIRSTDPHENNKNEPSFKSLNLEQVLNKTVCPIMVDYDVNENRVPRRIKVLKCAGQPSHCLQNSNKDPSHECCTPQDDYTYLECVEIRDKITVTYKDTPEIFQSLQVPVGCSCKIQKNTEATTIRGH